MNLVVHKIYLMVPQSTLPINWLRFDTAIFTSIYFNTTINKKENYPMVTADGYGNMILDNGRTELTETAVFSRK